MKGPLSLEAIRQGLARVSLAGFVRYTYPSYLMGWFHEELCQKLDQFLAALKARKSPRLIICAPPRSGKSELASRRFPAYLLGRDPNLSVIAASFSADLASKMSRDVQRIMDSPRYRALFPETLLPGKGVPAAVGYSRTVDMFEVAGHQGSYRSAGVGGGINGMGADCLVLDDVFKSRAEADSPTIRENVWDWYTSTFYTRLAPGGGILAIGTRWHQDDILGRLIERSNSGHGDSWDVFSYPAIAESDEAHRKQGEALHPERYDVKELMRIKAAVGSRDWEALYQQRPAVEGGTIFKEEWLKFYGPADLPKTFEETVISWDMTFKDGSDKDFAVGQVWGRQGGRFFLLDQVRRQMDFVGTLEAFVELAKKYPKATRKLVEDKANGPAVISALKSHVAGIVPVEPDGSKTARAYAVTPLFEAGNVFIPNPSWLSWVQGYVQELLQFPSAAHDDQVDATTQALRYFSQRPAMHINPALLRPIGPIGRLRGAYR